MYRSAVVVSKRIIALVIVFCPIIVFSLPVIFEGQGNINQLLYLGSADGKIYFKEGNISVNWQNANSFCNSSGMHLATVTSQAQRRVLVGAYNNASSNDVYWVGGRDSRTLSQFVWDYDGEGLNGSAVYPFSRNELATCVALRPAYGTVFYGVPCSHLNRVLCEIRN